MDDRDERPDLVVGRHPVDPARIQVRGQEGAQPVDQLVGRQPTDPLAVQPEQPVAVEHGAALLDRRKVETLFELLQGEDLLLGAGRPAEEREVVDQRLRQEALGAVVRDRRLGLALAHLRAVGVQDERQVRELRHVVAERLEQEDVLRRVREVVLAANDVGDPHRRVVHDHREVIERRAVGAHDDEVAAERRSLDLDAAADQVVEDDRAVRDPEAEDGPPPFGFERCALCRGEPRAAAVVARRQALRFEALPFGVEFIRGAVAGVREVRVPECRPPPPRTRSRRAIWRYGPCGPRSGPPSGSGPSSQSMPRSVRPWRMSVFERDRAARDIRVLEAKQEGAAHPARVEQVEERRPGGADVERAGGARGDPDADGRRDGSHQAPGTWWNSAGSASPGNTRTREAGRSPSVARPKGPSRVSESSDSERARIVTWAPGRRPRASR